MNNIAKYAQQIVHRSCEIKKDEKVFVSLLGIGGLDLLKEIQEEVKKAGADCFYQINDTITFKTWISNTSNDAMKAYFENQTQLISMMDVYITINAVENSLELGDITQEKMKEFMRVQGNFLEERAKKKYLACMVPTAAMAQRNNMSTDAFTEYFYNAVTFNHSKHEEGANLLKEMMSNTKKVHIVAPNTDLHLELTNIPVIICHGKVNLPDGEVFTAPVRESVNGKITFNTTSTYRGRTFSNITLVFEKGKVVEVSSSNQAIHDILDTDNGSRYLGEFAIGTNPWIDRPMDNVIFDEKLAGSIHIALGAAYPFADNGNKSGIHWDLILMLNEKSGGGSVYFDNQLVMKDGIFVIEGLKELNKK